MQLLSRALSILPITSTHYNPKVNSICTQGPYDEILPLSNYPPAAAYCSSNYPPASCNFTTTISMATVTQPPENPNVTVTYTEVTQRSVYGTSTLTIMDGQAETTVYTSTETETSYTGTETAYLTTETVTKTTTVSTFTSTIVNYASRPTATDNESTEDKRMVEEAKQPLNSAEGIPTGQQASLFSQVTKVAPRILSTACSCILPACSTYTSTSKTTVTATPRTRSVGKTIITPIAHVVTTHISAPATISTDTTTTEYTDSMAVFWVDETVLVKVTATATATITAYDVPPPPACTPAVGCSNRNNHRWELGCGATLKPVSGGTTVYDITTVAGCLDICDADKSCGLFSFDRLASACTMYPLGTGSEAIDNIHGAYGFVVGPCEG